MQTNFEKAIDTLENVTQRLTRKPCFVRSEFSDCAKFVFDEYPADFIEEFGIELIENGLLHLPFPKCYFEWPFKDVSQGFVASEDAGIVRLQWFEISKDESGAAPPRKVSLKELGDALIRSKGLEVIKDQCALASVHELAACVAALSVKNLVTDRVGVSAEVNQRRAKLGKPPLPSHIVVRLSETAARARGNGTHASPRPHFRRGHVRRLADKIVAVSPHFVMADPGNMPTYKVKS